MMFTGDKQAEVNPQIDYHTGEVLKKLLWCDPHLVATS